MKKLIAGCAAGLLSLNAWSQEEFATTEGETPPVAEAPAAEAAEPEPAAPAAASEQRPHARDALQGRYYVSPTASWVFTDTGRETDDGQAVSIAVGRSYFDVLTLEAFAQYNRLDHERGNDTANLIGLGVNSLFFPSRKQPAYVLLGGGYGDVSSHPGRKDDYGALLLNVGAGYWWKSFSLGFLKDVSLRTDAIYRLDAHNDRRTGADTNNGRKDFGDVLLSVGLMIPIGRAPEPAPEPAPVPVEVVAVTAAADSDSDGVADDLDQCPGTPAGAAVDAAGCPAAPAAAPASTCRPPEAGEKLDLSGCASGDVIVLKGVNFEFNKDRLTTNAKTILDGVSDALAAAPATNVELGGHTDGRGSEAYNQRLSERRACSVARYLDAKGVDPGRMTPAGFGESKPVADNETDEGREENRRVELRILDGAGSGLGACAGAAPASRARATEPAAQPEPAAPAQAVEAVPPEATSQAAAAAEPAAATEAPPPAEAPAATPEATPEPRPAAASTPAESMQQVPEADVFSAGSSPAPATAPAPASQGGGMQMVPESDVFGSN